MKIATFKTGNSKSDPSPTTLIFPDYPICSGYRLVWLRGRCDSHLPLRGPDHLLIQRDHPQGGPRRAAPHVQPKGEKYSKS